MSSYLHLTSKTCPRCEPVQSMTDLTEMIVTESDNSRLVSFDINYLGKHVGYGDVLFEFDRLPIANIQLKCSDNVTKNRAFQNSIMTIANKYGEFIYEPQNSDEENLCKSYGILESKSKKMTVFGKTLHVPAAYRIHVWEHYYPGNGTVILRIRRNEPLQG